MRLTFLWSIFHYTNMKQHIVLQAPSVNYDSIIQQTLSNGIDPYYKDRKLIRFCNDAMPSFKLKEETVVPLSNVYQERNGFPSFHMFSRSHYLQFSHSVYASIMSYADFCAMEDKLAHIIFQYLEDNKNQWLICMEDPFLVGSIREYGMKSSVIEKTLWITMKKTTYNDMIVMDMDNTNHPHL